MSPAKPLIWPNARLSLPISRGFPFVSRTSTLPWTCNQCRQQARAASNSPRSDVAAQQNQDGDAELPSQEEQRRSHISKRFTSIMDNLQSNIFFAGQRLNDLTGYSGIEKMKLDIAEQERTYEAAKDELAKAKEAEKAAVTRRIETQRESNDLLQRKNTWTPQDLERFTSLFRNDHANEQAKNDSQTRVTAAERAKDEASSRLESMRMARYHEEQIWSDKIRRSSTWGTWGLMGVNVLLFLAVTLVVEPWRRRRLVRGFEDKVVEALEKSKQHSDQVAGEALAALQASHLAAGAGDDVNLEVQAAADAIVSEEVAANTGLEAGSLMDGAEPGLIAATARAKLQDLFSNKEVRVRQVDLTQKALEGAFVGVMLTSIIAAVVRGR